MADFSSTYYPSLENTKALLIFLHGYNNTEAEMAPFYQFLQKACPTLAIDAPIGNFSSDSDSKRKSWYKISNFDPFDRRRLSQTSITEIVQIYNKTAEALQHTAAELNDYIDVLQTKHKLTDDKIYLAGFSQGAMLALWTALTRHNKIAGCFCFSGFAAADKKLSDNILSKPNVYLFHAKDDSQVQFKCCEYTLQWLKKQGIITTAFCYDKLGHSISDDELGMMADHINQNS